MRPVRPSSRHHPQSVYHPASQSHCPSIPPTVRPSSPPVRHTNRLSTLPSLHPRLVRPPPHPSVLRNVSQTVSHRPTVCTPCYNVCQAVLRHTVCTTHQPVCQRLYDNPTRPSDHPPLSHCLYDTPISPSACPSPADCLTATMTRPPVRTSFPTIHHIQDSSHSLAVVNGEQSHTIHCTQDSSHSLAVVNGEQSRKAKKFHRAFTNYDLLLHALDASSIYLCDFRRVAPPKSGEDAHVTRGKCDFGGATLNNPSLGCSYVLPRPWDPGGVSSLANTPRDLSRTIAPSRYPYVLLTGYLINLPSLRRWQDLRTSHVKLDNFIHGNIAGRTTAMNKITGSINIIIPALT